MDSHRRSGATATWRRLTLDDIDDLVRIAAQVHPSLPERDEVFAERVKLFPEGCLALVTGEDDELCGYIISYPIHYRRPAALDSLLGEVVSDANQYYIHDVAILPKARGGGLAKKGINTVLAVAKRYPTTCLVSVYGTTSFWGRFDFLQLVTDDHLQKKLLDYGPDATFLERNNHDKEDSN